MFYVLILGQTLNPSMEGATQQRRSIASNLFTVGNNKSHLKTVETTSGGSEAQTLSLPCVPLSKLSVNVPQRIWDSDPLTLFLEREHSFALVIQRQLEHPLQLELTRAVKHFETRQLEHTLPSQGGTYHPRVSLHRYRPWGGRPDSVQHLQRLNSNLLHTAWAKSRFPSLCCWTPRWRASCAWV